MFGVEHIVTEVNWRPEEEASDRCRIEFCFEIEPSLCDVEVLESGWEKEDAGIHDGPHIDRMHDAAEDGVENLRSSLDLEPAFEIPNWYDFVEVELAYWVDHQRFCACHSQGP